VLDAQTLRPRGRIALPGMVTVDAISPDGRWLYLVDYKDGNLDRYDVRAYDLERRRMVSKPVVDPREPDMKLQGFPVTRVQSPDGRWAYTLYTGDKPFIHALDTAGRTAVCIDVPQLTASDGGGARLRLSGNALQVANEGGPIARVDLTTFAVSAPRAAAATGTPTPTVAAPARSADGGPPWALWALPPVAFGVLAVVARRRRSAAA
jgi:hypothetical protein